MGSPQNLGGTATASDYVQLFPDQDITRKDKAITILAGQATSGLDAGQILARNKVDGKYKVLNTPVAVTSESLTLSPANPNGVKFVTTSLSKGPVIPGTAVLTGEINGVAAVLTDNGKGLLTEASNLAIGHIDYGTKMIGVETAAAMITADAFTAAYDHFNVTGGNMDLEDLVILPIDIDSTASDQVATGMEQGVANVDALTPTITDTDYELMRVFKKVGLTLKNLQD